jgi:thiamine biosynthesis lipoprotein
MKSRSNEVRRARPLLGTFVEITVAELSGNEAHRAIDAAFAVIEEVQRRMSFHDPASFLSEINRRAFCEPVEVDECTFTVLKTAEEVWQVSEGDFDITIAPRLQALGFLPGDSRLEHEFYPATFADVELLPDRRVRFHQPDLRLDLGGIAKGFAVDQAITVLHEHGVRHALVNAGGDLRALGSFPISIRCPRDPGQAFTQVTLTDAALATSAHYFADRLVPGATLGPILDPRSGASALGIQSATVRASTAMLADALTKIVMLRGEAALPVLDHFAADAIFVATAGDVLCSPRLDAALHLSS